MVILEGGRPRSEHIIRCNGPTSSEAPAEISIAKTKFVRRRNIVFRRRGELNSYSKTVFETLSVVH